MANQALIDKIAKDDALSTEDKLHLLRQVDPDFPTEATVRRPETRIETERMAPTPATQAAQRESFPRAATRGALRGLEYLVSPGLAASEFLLDKTGLLPPLQPGERPESEEVVGTLSGRLEPPTTAAGRIVERAGEELGAGGPFLGQARKAGALRKTIADYLAMGTGAGVVRETMPSSMSQLPGGQLVSEVFGQMGGLGLRRGAFGLLGMLKNQVPSIRETKAHSAFLERLGGNIGSVDEAKANIARAVELQQQFPRFQPTLGQAAGDPGLLALEEQARRTSPQLEAAMRKRGAESRQALSQGIAGAEEHAPAVTSRVSNTILRAQQTFDQQANLLMAGAQQELRTIEARYAERLNSLNPVTRAEAGQQILDEVAASRRTWSQEVHKLYNTGPAASAKTKFVNMDHLNEGLANLWKQRDVAELPESFPSELTKHILSLSKDPNGNKKAVTLESLRVLRSVVGQAEAAARAQAAPDPKLLKRLGVVQGLVEEQFDLALASPVFTVREVAALQKANDTYREGVQIYGQDPVAKLFRGGIHGEEPRMQPSAVAGMFLHGGKNGVEDARALVAAVGPDKGTQLLRQDALAQITNLRDTNGVLPPTRFEAWLRQHREVLNNYPTLRQEFGSLRAAQRSLESAKEAVTALPHAIKTPELLETEAAKLYLKKPTRLAIKGMLDKPNGPELLRDTTRLVQHDTVAMMGLRRGVWEELTQRMGLMVPENTLWSEHSATVAEIINKHRPTLHALYTPAQLKQLERVAEGEAILNRMPREQRVQLDQNIQRSGLADVVGKFWSRIFAVQRHAVGETFVLTEVASRRIIGALEGLDETKQRAILEHTLLSPDLMGTFNKLVTTSTTPQAAKVKFRQFLYTLGLESRAPGEDKP